MNKSVKANMDIRKLMLELHVNQCELAERLGITRSAVCHLFAREFPPDKKASLIQQIKGIALDKAERKENTVHEESSFPDEPQTVSKQSVQFHIGDLVKVPSKSLRTGTVIDIWTSQRYEHVMITVELDDGTRGMYDEKQLEPAPLPIEYSFTAVIDENAAVVTMNAVQGEKHWVVARGHAHILHDGDVGMAQAISYAARRMFESLDTINKNPDQRIYFKGDRKNG